MSDLNGARVSIVTRTKDRGFMLDRARASVQAQTYRDFIWVVVNDGGNKESVDKIVASASGIPVIVVHHPINVGMEAASNSGLSKSDSEFVLIHDDDDTLHPDFLTRTVGYLDQNPWCHGVVTQSMTINEVVHPDFRIEERNRRLWRPLISFGPTGAVQIADLLRVNQFPPISFLYRREAVKAIGGYDESLPVLGDWEFNLRFLSRYEIGVISEPLAYYHHRLQILDAQSAYGNSVHAGADRHLKFDALIRNRAFRVDVAANKFGMGMALVNARIHHTSMEYSSGASRIGQSLFNIASRLFRKN